jgi:ATP-binding cassette subfamily B protein
MLTDISFDLPAGGILGLVGPPGAGKTTLLNLIPRLYDVNAGRILVDGRDIRNVRLTDLRTQIAFVPQEPFLFAGTIRDNITLNRPDVPEPDMIAAARRAALHRSIRQFSNGYDTIVGEKGVILSGGQKQRVALARALLQTGPILILDDPISQVDMETGQQIIDTVRSMSGSRTIIIVSHRMSAVRFADRIITLENGAVTESGTHRQLVASDGYYAGSFKLQELEAHHYAV